MNSPSTIPTENPFETIFDEKDDEDSWKDEDISIASPEEQPRPKPSGSIATSRVGNVTRSFSRRDRKYSVSKLTREESKARQLNIKVQNELLNTSWTSTSNGFFTTITTQCFRRLSNTQKTRKCLGSPNETLWKSLQNTTTGSSSEKVEASAPELRQSQALTFSPLAERRGSSRPTKLKLVDDLSPNDRPIVIGISIPSARLAHHTTTPQTSTSIASTMMGNYGYETPTGKGLVTPSIVVTPAAHEISAWSPYSTASNVSRARTLSTHLIR
ncbi:hypothetical protein DID88_003565 [Monilinia fructigena]|uniref:Uncharacterized protein n=1 Tax=Monilinia fructigena TaxID=38457 RepID=A0A395ITR4_9HELO|nr:hypothetical protein DID88_003565 [Monilinia fructigena]